MISNNLCYSINCINITSSVIYLGLPCDCKAMVKGSKLEIMFNNLQYNNKQVPKKTSSWPFLDITGSTFCPGFFQNKNNIRRVYKITCLL